MASAASKTAVEVPEEVKGHASIYHALAAVRAALPVVMTDSNNPAFKSRYASLGAVQSAVSPALAANEVVPLFSLRTELLEDGRQLILVGLSLYHLGSGGSVASELGLIPAKPDPQAAGSAISYARRYLYVTMLDLEVDDDDGNAASKKPQSTPGKVLSPAESAERKTLFSRIHLLGEELYGSRELWDEKRPRIVSHQTGGRTSSSADMTTDELTTLIAALQQQIAKKSA